MPHPEQITKVAQLIRAIPLKYRVAILCMALAAVALALLIGFLVCRLHLSDTLGQAAGRGDIVAVQSALRRGADVNYQFEGWSALYLAASNGRADVVKLLLESGARPDLKTYEGQTALDVARTEEVKRLLRRAAPK